MNVQALLELAEAFRQAHPELAKHGFVLRAREALAECEGMEVEDQKSC